MFSRIYEQFINLFTNQEWFQVLYYVFNVLEYLKLIENAVIRVEYIHKWINK